MRITAGMGSGVLTLHFLALALGECLDLSSLPVKWERSGTYLKG